MLCQLLTLFAETYRKFYHSSIINMIQNFCTLLIHFCTLLLYICRVSKCAETYMEFYQQYHQYDPLVGQQESHLYPNLIGVALYTVMYSVQYTLITLLYYLKNL